MAMLVAAGFALPAQAQRVVCDIDYGGATQVIEAHPGTAPASTPYSPPYTAPTHRISDFFLFRLVVRDMPADLAGIDIYTYADLDRGPMLLHQASYPYPPTPHADGSFSGRQRVYEPLREGELHYRCRFLSPPAGASMNGPVATAPPA